MIANSRGVRYWTIASSLRLKPYASGSVDRVATTDHDGDEQQDNRERNSTGLINRIKREGTHRPNRLMQLD